MPRPRSPTLTDAEARVMSVLWKKERATVADVVGTLKRKRPVSYSTVQTILRILEDKGLRQPPKGSAGVHLPAARGRASGPPPGAEAPGRPAVQRLAESAGAQRARGRSDRARGIEPPEETDRRRIGAPVDVVLNWLTQGVHRRRSGGRGASSHPASRAQRPLRRPLDCVSPRARPPSHADARWRRHGRPQPSSVPAAAGPVVTVPAAWWASPSAAAGLWIVWSCIQAARLACECARRSQCQATRSRRALPSVLARLPHWSRVGATVVGHACCSRARFAQPPCWLAGHRLIAVAPTLIERLSVADLDRVLIHEWAHVQRHDDLAQLVQRIVHIVVGWHPAAWWLERQLEFEREVACDEIAVSVTGSAKEYATCLTTLAALPGLAPATGGRACGRVSAPPSCADCAHSDGPYVAAARPWRVIAIGGGVACWRARWSSPTCSSRRLRHRPRSLHQLRVRCARNRSSARCRWQPDPLSEPIPDRGQRPESVSESSVRPRSRRMRLCRMSTRQRRSITRRHRQQRSRHGRRQPGRSAHRCHSRSRRQSVRAPRPPAAVRRRLLRDRSPPSRTPPLRPARLDARGRRRRQRSVVRLKPRASATAGFFRRFGKKLAGSF